MEGVKVKINIETLPNVMSCVICGEDTDETLHSSEDGRSQVIKASRVRKNKLREKLRRTRRDRFYYHGSCYALYVQKTSV